MSQLSTASSGSLSSTLGSTGTVAPLERIGDYQIGEKLGKGAYGVVYKGLNLENGDFVAIKVLSTKGIPESQIESLKKEVTFLQKLRHKHIVKYVSNYSTDDHYYIMLEFVESGSLSGVIKRYGKLPENLVAVYMWQVLKGLKYLHRKGVIHRDIKGANILCTKESYIKLADFGVATKLSALDIQSRPKSSSSSESPSEVVGTPYWMAPEVIELNPPTFASDIWSVGCTVIELMTGRPPYYELNSMSALFRIVSDEMPPLPENISELGRDFLLRCFIKDPNARESAKQLLKHKWIRMAKKRVKRKQRMMEEAEADMDEFDDIEGYYDDDDEEYYDDDDEEDDDDDSDEDDEDEESEEEDEDEEEGEEEEGDESGSEEEEEEGEDPNAEAEEDNDEESEEEEEEEEGADNPEEAEEQEEEDEQDEEQEDEEENSKYATAQEGTLPPPASST